MRSTTSNLHAIQLAVQKISPSQEFGGGGILEKQTKNPPGILWTEATDSCSQAFWGLSWKKAWYQKNIWEGHIC